MHAGGPHKRYESMVIPVSAVEALAASPVSEQLRDAAAELAFRLAHGEFGELDQAQRGDLQGLAQMLVTWSQRVAAMEVASAPMPSEWRGRSLNS